MKNNADKFVWILLFSFLALGCNTTKYLKEDQVLYDKGQVEIHMDSIRKDRKKAFEEHLEEMILPKPNKKLLGWRYKLNMYYLGGGEDSTNNYVQRLLKKRGEKPVLMSDVNREYNENLLRNRMENLGFFNAYTESDTITKGKIGNIIYHAYPGNIYNINKVEFEVDSTEQLGIDILETKDQSLLIEGRNYNLETIISERERIDNDLKNQGYYFFHPDNLLVEVDSTIGNHKVNMYLMVKPETPETAKKPQKIGNIYIYPNYTLSDQGYRRGNPRSTELFDNNFYVIDPQNTFRKKVITNHIFFRRGDLYNRHAHNQSINHLVNLNTFKFVKNNFVESPDSANTLDVYYYLTPLDKKSIRLELLGKTAAVYNGSEVNVNWQLRNAFKGAELLSLNVFGGFETQTGGGVNLNSSYYRYGADVTVTWPRLLAPYKWTSTRNYIPKTFAKVGYEFLNRKSAYTLNSLNLNYGYIWRENVEKEHNLTVAEITYVQAHNISQNYKAQMDTIPTLKHIIEPQFSFGPNYTFTYTNSMKESLKNTFYFKGGLNLSGNVLGLIQGADYKSGKIKTLFNTVYSQFVKVDADFRHYLKLGRNKELASRIMIGTSYSYGNSSSLPYLKQYFTGGPNGLRAFRARSVGPGSVAPENRGSDNFFADQTGDFKLELNTEYRAKLASILDWAAFIDAGNIWLQHADADKPGAKLSKDFIKELAVGGGLGLRFDFTFLIIRTDFAIPFRLPYLPEKERWVFNDIDFRSSKWRKDNLVFNLAIGYPF